MGLAEYRRKRRFGVTPEPAGSTRARRAAKALAFVVQKHSATRLHYDVSALRHWCPPLKMLHSPEHARASRGNLQVTHLYIQTAWA